MTFQLQEMYCPVCGQIGPKKVSVRNGSDGPFAGRTRAASREIIRTFKCRCGVTFTHTEHEDQSGKPIAVRG